MMGNGDEADAGASGVTSSHSDPSGVMVDAPITHWGPVAVGRLSPG